MDWYAAVVRRGLFQLEAEDAHDLLIGSLSLMPPTACRVMRRLCAVEDPALGQELWGMRFRSPLGLAAGLDKNAVAIEAFSSFGFSHVEVGTVTALAQGGNPRPRLFRLGQEGGIINRMGFNNHGAQAMRERLSRRYAQRAAVGPRPPCILGINLGKSKVVDLAQALDDYRSSLRLLSPWADYLVVNVSSPNTPGLRDLQDEARLRPLLEGVRRELPLRIPLLVKISPDLTESALDSAVDTILETGCDGVIATNTTISREGLSTPVPEVQAMGNGGLSGSPLRARALAAMTRVCRRLRRQGRALPVIGVGGIDSAEAAWERIGHGASLVQIYSGLIYHGPALVRRIQQGLAREVRRAGLRSIAEAVGRDL
jgi:dihydroorotate dehydrogenase